MNFILKLYFEFWIDEISGEQYGPHIWLTVNGLDKVVQEHPAAAYDDVTPIYN